jgi:hypothetical protein
MAFLSGSLGFERFRVTGFDSKRFEERHLEVMQRLLGGENACSTEENASLGFLAGDHLFDHDFSLEKNVIDQAVHFAVRVDTNQVPSAVRKAWLQMELAALSKDNTSGRPTKLQRQEAKEAVEQRCEVEAASGKYRKMQQFPVLWEVEQGILYFGGSGGTASAHCATLLERAFDVELSRITAGTVAHEWAQQANETDAYDDLMPANFFPHQPQGDIAWSNAHRSEPDFLGNEFLMWLWWTLENRTDTIPLADNTEVTAMLTKTLQLECPYGESGKESITAESPVKLPEAMQAIRSGKLPRKTGMTLVRQGSQYDLVLQAESFSISAAKIHVDENQEEYSLEDRIAAIRDLCQTVDGLFQAFCAKRISPQWSAELEGLRGWLASPETTARQSSAA